MKRLSILFLFIELFAVSSQLQAQQTLQFDSNSSMLFREFKALVQESDGEVKVRMRLGSSSQGSTDELQAGDIIIMMDSKRIKTIQELKDQYAAAEDDAEMRIGVRRNDERFILRATKGDVPESSPGTQVVRSTGSNQVSTSGTGFTTSSSTVGLPEGSLVITELGLILSTEGESVKISQLLDIITPQEVKDLGIAKDTIIKKVNGKAITSANEVRDLFSEVNTGDEFTMEFEIDGKVRTLKMNKPKTNATVQRRN